MPRWVKIGATTKKPSIRMAALSNQSVPFPFEIILLLSTEHCLEIEQYLHNRLKEKQVAKEFFRINKKTAEQEVCDILECAPYLCICLTEKEVEEGVF